MLCPLGWSVSSRENQQKLEGQSSWRVPVRLCAGAFLGSPGPACHLSARSLPAPTDIAGEAGYNCFLALSVPLWLQDRGAALYSLPPAGGGGDGSIGGRALPGPSVSSARADQLSGGRVHQQSKQLSPGKLSLQPHSNTIHSTNCRPFMKP